MRRIKELGVEIKQRRTDTFENIHEGCECGTDREGNRGGEEWVKGGTGGRMKCHGETWGGGSSIQSSHKSEGRFQCSLPCG